MSGISFSDTVRWYSRCNAADTHPRRHFAITRTLPKGIGLARLRYDCSARSAPRGIRVLWRRLHERGADARATPTISTVPRRRTRERTDEGKRIAISYAAYGALTDLFPTQVALFDETMAGLGLDPGDRSDDGSLPSGVGNAACAAVLDARRRDGANQLGDENGGASYSDYTGYQPVNTPDTLLDPNRWQPLRGANGAIQTFLGPHWRNVTPFALTSADQFRPPAPAQFPDERYSRQAAEILSRSAPLTDRHKVIAEYWADGPGSVTPPGHWNLFAQFVSKRDDYTLDDDVRMFFALNNALLDASIAVWAAK